MGKSRKGCCIRGCGKSYSNSPGTIFYNFPSKSWEQELKEKWISAINRKGWYPTKNSFICSSHFIGNKRSKHPYSPSYVPSIFPAVKSKKGTQATGAAILKRAETRKNKIKETQEKEITENVTDLETRRINSASQSTSSYSHKYVQVNKGKVDGDMIFECIQSVNNVQTQANIPETNLFETQLMTTETSTQFNSNDSKGFRGFESVKSNSKALKQLSGVDKELFDFLLKFMRNKPKSSLSKENRLFLFLIKLKHGYPYSVMSVLFGICRMTASLIFRKVLLELSSHLKDAVIWPSREEVQETMPAALKTHYPRCRLIMDCVEMRCEMPDMVDTKNYLYSQHKHGYTVKFLIGIAPNGQVSFISDCYGGRTSDAFITTDCGLLNLLEPDDVVLADKGFPGIQETFDKISVVVPSREVSKTFKKSSVRVHVEKCIQRLKDFEILKCIPLNIIPHVDEIICVISAIVNLWMPIIKDPLSVKRTKKQIKLKQTKKQKITEIEDNTSTV